MEAETWCLESGINTTPEFLSWLCAMLQEHIVSEDLVFSWDRYLSPISPNLPGGLDESSAKVRFCCLSREVCWWMTGSWSDPELVQCLYSLGLFHCLLEGVRKQKRPFLLFFTMLRTADFTKTREYTTTARSKQTTEWEGGWERRRARFLQRSSVLSGTQAEKKRERKKRERDSWRVRLWSAAW